MPLLTYNVEASFFLIPPTNIGARSSSKGQIHSLKLSRCTFEMYVQDYLVPLTGVLNSSDGELEVWRENGILAVVVDVHGPAGTRELLAFSLVRTQLGQWGVPLRCSWRQTDKTLFYKLVLICTWGNYANRFSNNCLRCWPINDERFSLFKGI